MLGLPTLAQAQVPLPPIPDQSGWGPHILAVARDPRGAVWAGTYGDGIYRLQPGSETWDHIRRDTTATSIAWDHVHALAFGPRGQVWYGTIGNGFGVSHDNGNTWKNWTFTELGPNWQYVAPSGIVTRGDTTWVGTADGILMTVNDGRNWLALVDSIGPIEPGPADSAVVVLPNEYVDRIAVNRRGLLVSTLRGRHLLTTEPDGTISRRDLGFAPFPPLAGVLLDGRLVRGTQCGFKMSSDTTPCLRVEGLPAEDSLELRSAWFRRPISRDDNPFIDQTYRYGSTMGGNFQQHQGVEFNNPDGTPVRAVDGGSVVYAGAAEQGALTVAVLHDSTVRRGRERLHLFSVYYHNSTLHVSVGDRVSRGQLLAEVGNTGRATNDHLHLEIHAAPSTDVAQVVDSLQRYPPYTTNPELWLEPLPGMGLIAGRVRNRAGDPVPQARIYGLPKHDPPETPLSFIETYGDRAHSHPLYDEDFAITDVPPGVYVLGTEIDGRRVYRTVTVYEGMLSWVVFRP